jgi:hypothetical protein
MVWHRIAARASIGVLLGLALTSTAIAASRQPPRAEVISLAPLAAGSSSHVYRVTLVFDNQDTEPLLIGEVKFTVRVLGQGVLTGRSSGALTVEALDRLTLEVEVDGEAMPSFSQLKGAASPAGKLDYELFGSVTLAKGGKKRLPIQARGALTLAAPASD